jgi:cobalt-zinc-cadmium efflux system outer membrane protein
MLVVRSGLLIFLYCLQLPIGAFAQSISSSLTTDTLQLTLKEAEKIFFDKNLSLLAQQYHVQADKALIEQAKLWDNPVLNTDQNVYVNHKWFEHTVNSNGSYNGQVYVQIAQLIKTANKRGKLIQLAKTNAAISEWQFKDVMRNLKYQLRKDFFTIDQLLETQRLYQTALEQINTLLNGMKEQYKLGNIAQKDLLRIQALQIATQQQAVENERGLSDVQAELKTLLQISDNVQIIPVMAAIKVNQYPVINVQELTTTAKNNNPSYQLEQLQLQYQKQNLSYQKSLAIPDVTLAPNYDRNSNYAINYTGLGISLPLPVFNRNQGNIKNAQWQMKEQEVNTAAAAVQLENEVFNAYQKWRSVLQLVNTDHASFQTSYGKLYNNILESYKQRQISLVEFIDYFNTYKEVRENELELKRNLLLTQEEINYQTGTDMLP